MAADSKTFYLYPVEQITVSGSQNKAVQARSMTLNGFVIKPDIDVFATDWISNCTFDNNKNIHVYFTTIDKVRR